MPGDLRVSFRLTAEDLMSPQIVEALTKLQVLEQATLRINNGQQAAAGGAHAHAAAQAELAEKASLSTVALEHATEVGSRFGEEFLAGAARIGASLISFELLVGTYEKITEAAREAEVANRHSRPASARRRASTASSPSRPRPGPTSRRCSSSGHRPRCSR
jgi:hypothetical protein